MRHKQTEIILINRIPTLRKLTVSALIHLGWENILEFSDLVEGRDYLNNNPDQCILLLELNVNKATDEVEMVEHLNNSIPVIATIQVPNKELMMELSKVGIKDIILKTFDISEYSINLNKILEEYIIVEEPN